jgi:hypothetical protein
VRWLPTPSGTVRLFPGCPPPDTCADDIRPDDGGLDAGARSATPPPDAGMVLHKRRLWSALSGCAAPGAHRAGQRPPLTRSARHDGGMDAGAGGGGGARGPGHGRAGTAPPTARVCAHLHAGRACVPPPPRHARTHAGRGQARWGLCRRSGCLRRCCRWRTAAGPTARRRGWAARTAPTSSGTAPSAPPPVIRNQQTRMCIETRKHKQ